MSPLPPSVRACLTACLAATVVASTVACGGPDSRGPDSEATSTKALARGAPTPTSFGFDPGRPGVALVIRPEDCVSCVLTEPARELRALQRQTDDRVQFLTVVVTERPDEDRRTVAEFLATERVESLVVPWTPGKHRDEVGDAPLPSVYVTHGGRVVEVVDERTTTRMRLIAQGTSLTEMLNELLGEGGETDDTKADADHADDTESTNPGGNP